MNRIIIPILAFAIFVEASIATAAPRVIPIKPTNGKAHVEATSTAATSSRGALNGPGRADERRAELKNKTPTERRREANKTAVNAAQTLAHVEEALEHHAAALKKNIEAFTRRGVDADADRAKLEADIAKLPAIKSSIASLASDAASIDPANKEVFALYREKIKTIRDQLKIIRDDMQDIVHDLRAKVALLEQAANATTTPAPQR